VTEAVLSPKQTNPAATTLTDAYTVPAAGWAVVDVVVCNRGAATSYRLAVSPLGVADDVKHYLRYGIAIGANAADRVSRITLGAGDVVRVYATDATLTFSVVGVETTP
jgi:hypothetical protein